MNPALLAALLAASHVAAAPANLASAAGTVTVCTSTQCLEGTTGLTTGATLSSSSESFILLPDTYDSASATKIPPALLAALTASKSTLNVPSSSGLVSTSNSSKISLPLTISPLPGVTTFSGSFFTQQTLYTDIANATNLPLSLLNRPSSLILPQGVWAVLGASGSGDRVVLWSSVSDLSQLPSSSLSSNSLSLLNLQSSSCSTPCSSHGSCSPSSSTCTCPPNFAGTACESCAKGFFGPNCQACPANCPSCDDGPTGSGRCLGAIASDPPSSCNCQNGVCGTGGSCACNAGWTSPPGATSTAGSTNSTQCSVCAPGFSSDGAGNCSACSLNCLSCTSGGTCSQCRPGFSPDPAAPANCIVTPANSCTDGQFANPAGGCAACSPLCKTCTGGDSTNCIICGAGRFNLNGTCVAVDGSGVCAGAKGMVANNVKNECDACPAGCTSCQIPNFSIASTISQVQCTACLPGSVLTTDGKCVAKCPAGTFVNAATNTCTACDPSCATCAGDKSFCLTCTGTQLASNGTCANTCPTNTFSSSGACLACHADCASCSGAAFNQCTTCPAGRPVSSSGRCLATCAQNEYFDPTAGKCAKCDAGCTSCAGAGSAQCLGCPAGQVLQGGKCVAASCGSGAGWVSALGVCLSDLMSLKPGQAGAGNNNSPTAGSGGSAGAGSGGGGSQGGTFAWWQWLLLALGGAAIIALGLVVWRSHARRVRKQETRAFRDRLDGTRGWKGWFGFGAGSGSGGAGGARVLRRSGSSRSARSGGTHAQSAEYNPAEFVRRVDGLFDEGRTKGQGRGLEQGLGQGQLEKMSRTEEWRHEMGQFPPPGESIDGRSGNRHSLARSTNSESTRSPPDSPTRSELYPPSRSNPRTSVTSASVYSQNTSVNERLAANIRAQLGIYPHGAPPLPPAGPSSNMAYNPPNVSNATNAFGPPSTTAPLFAEPRQPIKDTTTLRTVTFAPLPTTIASPVPRPFAQTQPLIEPLVDVPIGFDGASGRAGGAYWIANTGASANPSGSAGAGAGGVPLAATAGGNVDRNPFRRF
ncbi:hypothetical protein BOTBODRAFT_28987 [Botryobasidium botryosum FD-172 SS1]|uniref:EGF-like domain-containing protein n=1 Tax=Botryobasidium botryosum (strain FD-172 SS1) TaxID=930990 RepID=A0A067MS90_BOTB1|nr:hypothetical protein BOTBODRAFT_28987 [Botryobasidium botryosum FD-172 SS1]